MKSWKETLLWALISLSQLIEKVGLGGELLNQEKTPTKFLSGDVTRKGVAIPWLIFMTDK